ncbi:MAG: 2,3-bisphosphoglycerate-independent phosphoglycerate mutase, partial [Gammaproteobacteria bacterium]
MTETRHSRPKPIVLTILDGWGVSEATENNAIAMARTPIWDRLLASCPHRLIQGSGAYVGLPEEQMGNSEVGHLNLGAGRVIEQEYTKIFNAIQDGRFDTNEVLNRAFTDLTEHSGTLHVAGLLSEGGVHSHEAHIHALIRLAARKGVKKMVIHPILDGRDVAPKSARVSLERLQQVLDDVGVGYIGSVIGRYFAMDRDQRWERIQKAYDLWVSGKAEYQAGDAVQALERAYERGETDEFVTATRIGDAEQTGMQDGDVLIMMNFRADRARQIISAFTDVAFTGFARESYPRLDHVVTLTEYREGLTPDVVFPPEKPKNVFGEYISSLGLKQLRIAETEKYAHVTFFLNGGRENPFVGEDRILVPSPKVATYDLKPEMSAEVLTDKLVDQIKSGGYDVIICNYANPDMVGHTGNLSAAIKAIETIDTCLGRLTEVLQETGGELLVTADHGNA